MKGWLIHLLVTAFGCTVRYRISDPHNLLANTPRHPLIFVFWHNRIFLTPHLFRKYWRPRGHERVAVLISRSKDGQLLADVLAAFGLRCVRGSSSRGGQAALLELKSLLAAGYDIGITPDGPRGPKYTLQPGCIGLAQLTGAPIVPISYDLAHKITLKSWDAFMIPLPFTTCHLRLGAPVTIPPTDEVEPHRAALEAQLRQISTPV